jgi:hypothetical protein
VWLPVLAADNNVHPTDLGHWRIANFYTKFLPPLLAGHAPPPQRHETGATTQLIAAAAAGEADAVAAPAPTPIVWTNFTSLEISGRAFNDTPSPFNRLPATAQKTVRAPVCAPTVGLFHGFRELCFAWVN